MLFSRAVFALIDVVMPEPIPGTDPLALRHAAQHLVGKKITDMSLPMRCAVVGLVGCFELSALMTVGSVFSHASLGDRRAHAQRAQSWPLVPFRELVRLVRSFTLVAFYDHPATRTALGFRPGGYASAS
jgi:hypothetical protein